MDNERYLRGWAKLKKIDGEAGEQVISSLSDIAPDFATLLIEFPSSSLILMHQVSRSGATLCQTGVPLFKARYVEGLNRSFPSPPFSEASE